MRTPQRLRRLIDLVYGALRTLNAPPSAGFTQSSPIERFLFELRREDPHVLFDESYDVWRAKRIRKILQIYGLDYFPGKRILELGSAHSEIGAFFAELGAEVTCLEGRDEHVLIARLRHRKLQGLTIEQFDLEGDFTHLGRFDLIIDVGLLYHLPDVAGHLRQCFAAADEIILETVVCDSSDPLRCDIVPQDPSDPQQSLRCSGSRPSQAYVERLATEAGFQPVLFATPDLNVGNDYVYDWPVKETGAPGDFRTRRFWRLTKAGAATSVSP